MGNWSPTGAGLQKPIALAAVILDPAAAVRMIRIRMSTALVIGEGVGRICIAGCVHKTEAGLHSVSAR